MMIFQLSIVNIIRFNSLIKHRCQFSAISAFSSENNDHVAELSHFIRSCSHLISITGAGCSTDSGIPDYRGPAGSYSLGHKPMIHSDFVNKELSRKRYWARSMVGYKQFGNAQPNKAHLTLAQLEQASILKAIITQNVDRLHQKAGSKNVIDLHGRNDIVRCLSCNTTSSRRIIQQQICNLNPSYDHLFKQLEKGNIIRADGDADLAISDYSKFTIPACSACGGVLKPDVVFFGDSVPVVNVQNAMQQADACDGLLVIGSSLEVYSAYRLVDRVAKRGVPIAIINMGETRAERSGLPIALKAEVKCSLLMEQVSRQLQLVSHY